MMASELKKKNKDELIDLINSLKEENAALKEIHKLYSQQNERMEKLEREFYRNQQYHRRNSIEISGIPSTVDQKNLETEVIRIYNTAQVIVDGDEVSAKDIQAAHRIGKKGVVICKFVNRKWAYEGLYNGKNLKDRDLYGNNSKVYINNSFCDEFRHLNFLIRRAKKNDKISRWRVKNGINFIKIKDDDFVEVSHINDLIQMKIAEVSE